MNKWRNAGAFGKIPAAYIEFHKDLAEKDLALKDGWLVHSSGMADDGWYDGMGVLHAVIEVRSTQKLHKVKWSDTNQGFMYRCDGGGWASSAV